MEINILTRCRYTKILQVLSGIDIFGQQFTLNINGKRNYTTAFGGMTSLVVISIVILSSWSTIQNFFSKSSLQVEIFQQYDQNGESIILNANNFLLAIGFEQENKFDEAYFEIVIRQMQILTQRRSYVNNTLVKTDFELQLCPENKLEEIQFSSDINLTYQMTPFSRKYLCLKNNQTFKVNSLKSVSQELLQVLILKCQNQSISNCASEDEINSYFSANKQITINIYFLNYIINPYETGNSFVKQFLDDSFSISFIPKKLQRKSTLYLKKNQFFTDESILPYENYVEKQINLITGIDKNGLINLGSDDDEVYATVEFYKDPFSTVIERRYLKLHTLLSQIGGLLQALSLVLGSIIVQYNKLQMSLDLANELFQFEKDQKIKIEQIEQLNQINNLLDKQQQSEKIEKHGSLKNSSKQIINTQLDSSYCGKEVNKLFFNVLRNQVEYQSKSEQKIEINPRNRIISKQFNFENNNTNWVRKFGYTNSRDYFQKSIQAIFSRYSPLSLNFKFLINQITFGKVFSCDDAKLLHKAIKKINMLSDSKYIFEKLNEIQKIKQILLSEDQQTIFNFTSKPVLTLKPDRKKSRTSLYKQYSSYIIGKQNKFEDLLINYERVLKVSEKIETEKKKIGDNDYKHQITRRILLQLDPELLTIHRLRKYIENQEIIEQYSDMGQQFNSQECLVIEP